MKGEDFSCTA